MLFRSALAASLRGAGQGAMEPMQAELGGIGIPVTVVAGALDPTGEARARDVAGAIPGARLVVIPDAGHAPHREAPAPFARALATHLARVMEVCAADSCAVHVADDRPVATTAPSTLVPPSSARSLA